MARIMSDDFPGGGSRAVDLVHLARQTLGDRDLEREVLALFERQSAVMVERLRHATTAKTWAEAAHTLKGSALGIGAFGVAEAAEAVECAQVDHLSSEAWRKLARLEAAVASANAFIADIAKAA
ncbi:Hpt domain-containing protein [Phreatobacter aquaticus]|uniref:Hpt domain-containing protein n=2 Tax=Phreatobacter aquaticus TaxID=2570229 RepID=A0A4D7QR89_9HYPH|nr:Hpt domain-containing protein [Phreatobacter aquaticus]